MTTRKPAKDFLEKARWSSSSSNNKNSSSSSSSSNNNNNNAMLLSLLSSLRQTPSPHSSKTRLQSVIISYEINLKPLRPYPAPAPGLITSLWKGICSSPSLRRSLVHRGYYSWSFVSSFPFSFFCR